jgi:hypothetical protein
MPRLTLGILAFWVVWALVFDVIADGVFFTFRAFGLISRWWVSSASSSASSVS